MPERRTAAGEAASQPRRDPRLGALLAIASATGFGGITTLAALAYTEGATPMAAVTLRFLVGFLAFAAVCLLRGRPLLLPRGARLAGLATGFFWFVASFGYLGSVNYIPVSLAVVIFFTFPILTALGEAALERRRPRLSELGLLLLAFAGIALSVGPRFGELSPTGLALIALGAFGAAGLFLSMRVVAVRQEPMTLLVTLNLSGALLSGLTLAAFGGWALAPFALPPLGLAEGEPTAWAGWTALTLASLCYVGAIFLQSGSVRHAGPSRAALFFNIEPVVSIGFAAVLLGEQLSAQQLAGSALVLTALVLAGRRRA